MITEYGGKIISIDAKIIPIDPETNKNIFDDYLEKVEDLVQFLIENPNQEAAQFRLVRDAITGCTGWDIDVEGTLKMQKGFFSVIEKCAALDISNEVKNWVELLRSQGLEVNPNVLSFLQTTIGTLVRMKNSPSNRVTVSGQSKKKRDQELAFKKSEIVSGLKADRINEEISSKNETSSVVKAVYPWKYISVPAEKPSGRRYCSTVLYQGKMYIFGGEAISSKPLNDLYVFDFGNNFFYFL